MKKLMSFILCVIAFFSRGVLQAESKNQKNKETSGKKQKEKKMEETKIILSRSEIAEKLKELKKKPLPKNLSIGAECYEIAQKPERVEYVCPVCGNKTLYTNSLNFDLVEQISYLRALSETLKKYGITLEERALCKNCQKQVSEKSLCIMIPYQEDGQNIYRRCEINETDLVLLKEFLSGKDIHQGFTDEETPLAEYIERLQVLLGVKVK